jgi:CRISPR/Cas system-associated exonuclease Cas4 (RecB family)
MSRPTKTRWHSVSSTREYEDCPRRYHFGYVEKRPKDRPVPPTWRFGSVVHEALEAAYRCIMAAPGTSPVEHLPAAIAALDEALRRHGLDPDEDRQRAIDVVTGALETDVLGAAERGTPLGVEIALRDRIDATDRVIGFVDLVLPHDDASVELIDHKVTSRRATDDELRDDFQLNLYGWLARKRWPGATRIVATLHYPTGPDRVSVELAEDGMQRANERLRRAATAIAQDTTFEARPSERCLHCPWQPSCPEGSALLTGVRT